MLREGLRREIPEVFEWAARAPRPRISRTRFVWTVLAALGAKTIVAGIVGACASLVLSFAGPRPWPFPPIVGAVTFAGVAMGAALAWRLGRWRGLAGYAGALAALQLLTYLAGAPWRAMFCERAGDPCPLPLWPEVLLAQWPLAAGILAAPLLARAFSVSEGRSNPSLEAAGAFIVPAAVLHLAALPFARSADPTGVIVASSILNLGTAIASGHVLVRRGGRPWPGAVVLAGILFGVPWIPSLIRYAEFRATESSPGVEWLMISPVGHALALVLGAVVSAAFARRRPPGADAAHRAAR